MGVWIETDFPRVLDKFPQVTPFVGVWIETLKIYIFFEIIKVTPFVGVWIETMLRDYYARIDKSHPSWVCGLKLIRLSEMRLI